MIHNMIEELHSPNGRHYGKCSCKWRFTTYSGMQHYTKYVSAHLDTGVPYTGREL